jgi:hypothetical protein
LFDKFVRTTKRKMEKVRMGDPMSHQMTQANKKVAC